MVGIRLVRVNRELFWSEIFLEGVLLEVWIDFKKLTG